MAEVPSEAVTNGKRKTSVARVRMKLGSGNVVVNGRPLEQYFPRESLVKAVQQAFEESNCVGRYDVVASIHGGGVSGQAGALRHGIARAIQVMDPPQRVNLKRAGLLTRDSRKKERKKYGQRGARARFQFSKR